MSGGREGVDVWGQWEVVVDLNNVIKQNRSVLVFSGLWMTYGDLFDVWRVASEGMDAWGGVGGGVGGRHGVVGE